MKQKLIIANGSYEQLDSWIGHVNCVFLVCDRSVSFQKISSYFEEVPVHLHVKIVRFSDFKPNPQYESVVNGVKLFREEKCDAIIAFGGGSAMDVAKCIKLYTTQPGTGEDGEWLEQDIKTNSIPFLAIPSTAGTGSEATRYAVIYYNGKKQSITSESIIPQNVLLDASILKTLPEYQKKVTMCDALCHAIESLWSVNSTDESQKYSVAAIQGVMNSMNGYLTNTDAGNEQMLLAANMAGKAINITQTTAGHAMCYKITSLFGCSHGHAAILCDRILFPWMIKNTDLCIDSRGEQYLIRSLDMIGWAMGCENALEGAKKLQSIFDYLKLEVPAASEAQFEELKSSVNLVRLKNHPITLDENLIDELYHKILRSGE